MKKRLMQLWKDEEGATMVEYGIMVALIAAVCIVAVGAIGTQLDLTFDSVVAAVTPAAAP